jgi:hypothetical protein
MNQIQKAKIITDTIHKVISESDLLKTTRCLYTSAVTLDIFKRYGIECKLWQGTTNWYSKKYVAMIKAGADFSVSVNSGADENKLKKKAEALRKKGVLAVSCIANQARTPDELGGHVAVLAKIDNTYYLVDPTSFQFKRTQNSHNATINAPDVFYFELMSFEYNMPEDFLYMDDEFGAFYDFTELNSLIKLQNHPDVTQTDFNPFKYKALYDKISENIKLLINE